MAATDIKGELTPAELQKLRLKTCQVRVHSITYQGEDINAYEVVSPSSQPLPAFTAGAHIDLYFRDGRIRQYSLCNDPVERHRYVFAVQREVHGRGGSKAIFDKVHVGRTLVISEPRNNFSLAPDAKRHLLIAGGIGITPIMSMVHALSRINSDFDLHYCTRTAERTAFREELAPFVRSNKAVIRHDGGDPKRGLNLNEILADYVEGTHLYFCGPAGLLHAVTEAASHWPSGAVHNESFTPPLAAILAGDNSKFPQQTVDRAIPVGFQIRVTSTGAVYEVPQDKTILEVLRENGFDVPTSCEAGLCGTCRTRFLEGEADHRDYILKDAEKCDQILVCCSRAKSPLLVLDI
jgi:vanillate O-demethylase ferredoxin subunit